MTPHARAILDAARRELTPTAAEVERLRSRLGASPPPPDDAEPQAPGQGVGGGAANWGLYVVAVIAVAVIGLVLGMGRDADRTAQPPASEGLEEKPVAVEIVASAPEQEHVMVDEVAETGTEASVEDASSAPQQQPTTRASRRRNAPSDTPGTKEQVAEEDQEDAFAAELRLIIRARRALARGDRPEVRSTVRRYREAFAGGSFVEEAEVLDLLAQCSAGVSEPAKAAASRYVEGASPMFAERVRRACLTDDE